MLGGWPFPPPKTGSVFPLWEEWVLSAFLQATASPSPGLGWEAENQQSDGLLRGSCFLGLPHGIPEKEGGAPIGHISRPQTELSRGFFDKGAPAQVAGGPSQSPPQTGGMEMHVCPQRPDDRHFWHREGMGSSPRGNTGAVGGQSPTRCRDRGGRRAGEKDAGPMHPRGIRASGKADGARAPGLGRETPGAICPPIPAPLRSFEMLTRPAPGRAPPPSPGDPLISPHHPRPPPPPRFQIAGEGVARKMREGTTDKPAGHGRGLRPGPPPHSPTSTHPRAPLEAAAGPEM